MVSTRLGPTLLGPALLGPALLGLALLGGCQPDDPCAGGSMLDSPGGLVVTAAEHPAAWGRPDCFECHIATELHRTGCTPDVDLADIQARVSAEGTAACAACHGDMGNPATTSDSGGGDTASPDGGAP